MPKRWKNMYKQLVSNSKTGLMQWTQDVEA